MFRIFLIAFIFLFSTVSAQNAQSARLVQAQNLASQGKNKEALDEYRAILAQDKNNAEAYIGAGQVRLKLKEYKLAIDNFQLAQKNNPKLTKAVEGEAEAQEGLGQKDKAVAAWRKLSEIGNKEQKDKAQDRIGVLLGTTKAPAPATTPAPAPVPSVQKGKFSYDSPEFKAGLAATEQKKWNDALKNWREVLKKEPGNPGAFYYAGVARYSLNDPENAIINFNKSFDYPEKGFNANYYLGRIYEQKGDKQKAISYYKKYLELTQSPSGKQEVKDRIARLGGAGTEVASGKSSSSTSGKSSESAAVNKSSNSYECNSLESCQKAEEKKKQDSIAAYLESLKNKPLTVGPEKIVATEYGQNFAFASTTEAGSADLQKSLNLIQKKSFQSAIDALQETRQKFPSTPNAMAAAYNLLSLYQYLELHDKVIALASSVLQEPIAEPYKSAIAYILATSQVKKTEFGEAYGTLDSVKTDGKLGPSDAQKKSLAAEIATQYKPDSGSPDILKKAIDAEPDKVKKNELRLKLAKLYLKLQDSPNAIQTYKDIVEDCPQNTNDPCRKAIYELGDLSFLSQNWAMALEYYNKAMEQQKDTVLVPWALFQIGNVFRKQGNYAESVRSYDKLIKNYSGNYWADQAKLYKDDAIWQESNQGVLKK
ncbi:hypothetical protein AGMMS49938_02200 [Fibrobacterales bacterium]|nr:hypothetical protein AGMMS49938_02200 [Fibrobacterales bacterium]